MRFKIVHQGKHLGTIRIKDDLILGWSKSDIKILCQAIFWEKAIRPLINGEIWYNPYENEKTRNFLQKIK